MPPQKSQTKIAELSEKNFSRTIFAHLDYIRNMRRIHNFEKNYAVSLKHREMSLQVPKKTLLNLLQDWLKIWDQWATLVLYPAEDSGGEKSTAERFFDNNLLRSMSLFFWEVRRPWLKFFDGSNGEVQFFLSGLGAEIEN